MPVSEADVIEALRPVHDPELHRSIVDLGMVRGVDIVGSAVTVRVALTVAGCPLRAEITNRVEGAVTALDGVESAVVDFSVMTDEERAAVRELLIGDPASTAGSTQAHGHAQGRAIPFAEGNSRTRVLLVSSGKGGVGKSSVTVNLALALAARGKRVAALDADVYGFSVPRMLGVQHEPQVIDEMIVPPETHGVTCISMGMFAREDQPVIWRGPMLHKFLEQMLTDVFWDEPDYLVVDLPPGTGDVSLSLSTYLPGAEALVVTTPQPAAQKVAQRSALMFRDQRVRIRVVGVIENMSWFTGDDGKQYALFGAGGGQQLADDLEVPLLGRVPLVPELRAGGDAGRPITIEQPDHEASQVFAEMARRIDEDMKPTKVFRKELSIK